jgi:hypothetical protein
LDALLIVEDVGIHGIGLRIIAGNGVNITLLTRKSFNSRGKKQGLKITLDTSNGGLLEDEQLLKSTVESVRAAVSRAMSF